MIETPQRSKSKLFEKKRKKIQILMMKSYIFCCHPLSTFSSYYFFRKDYIKFQHEHWPCVPKCLHYKPFYIKRKLIYNSEKRCFENKPPFFPQKGQIGTNICNYQWERWVNIFRIYQLPCSYLAQLSFIDLLFVFA